MLQNIFSIIIIIFITLIPVVIWGYLFSYFNESTLNRKRFFVWILAWAISVFPILHLEDFISKTNFDWLNIFENIYNLNSYLDLTNLFLSFFWVLFLILTIPFIFFLWYENIKQKLKTFYKDYVIFCLYLIWFWFIIFLLWTFFDLFNFSKNNYDFWLKFWDVAFNSFKLIIFYYLIIWLIEELSKFFCFSYSKLFSKINLKETVLYWIFVALWFAFIENILYFYKIFEAKWMWKDLIFVYFSRNIFSVILHILCSSIFSYYFWILYFKIKERFSLEYIKILFIWFIISIVLHWLFDIFITFWLWIFIFIYILWAYFYLTYIFYKEWE